MTDFYTTIDTLHDVLKDDIDTKQNTLTAGANVSIDADTNTISATDTTYTAGNGIELTSGEFRLGFPTGRFDSTTGNTLDLNNVTVEGFHRYYINTEYVQNFPEDAFYSTGEFYVNLLVIKSYSVNRNAQILYVVDARCGRLFYRTKATTSVWGRWQRIDDEPQPEADTKTVVTPVGSTVYFRTIDCVQDTNNTLTYKWQLSSNYGRTWQDSSGTGHNTNTLTVSASAGRNNYLYRCVISGATQSITTTASRLVVLS